MVGQLVHGYKQKTVDVYAIGGIYNVSTPVESNDISHNLSVGLIRRMIKSKYTFNVIQWCCCQLITEENDEGKIYPAKHGLCWDRSEKRARPAVFRDRGPERILRAADFFANKGIMRNRYKSKT